MNQKMYKENHISKQKKNEKEFANFDLQRFLCAGHLCAGH